MTKASFGGWSVESYQDSPLINLRWRSRTGTVILVRGPSDQVVAAADIPAELFERLGLTPTEPPVMASQRRDGITDSAGRPIHLTEIVYHVRPTR